MPEWKKTWRRPSKMKHSREDFCYTKMNFIVLWEWCIVEEDTFKMYKIMRMANGTWYVKKENVIGNIYWLLTVCQVLF